MCHDSAVKQMAKPGIRESDAARAKLYDFHIDPLTGDFRSSTGVMRACDGSAINPFWPHMF